MSLSIIKTNPDTGSWLKDNSQDERSSAARLAHEIKEREFREHGFHLAYLCQTILDTTRGFDIDLVDRFKGMAEDLIHLVSTLDEADKYHSFDGAGQTIYMLHGVVQLFEALQYRTTQAMLYHFALDNHEDGVNVKSIAVQYYREISGDKDAAADSRTTEEFISLIHKFKPKQ